MDFLALGMCSADHLASNGHRKPDGIDAPSRASFVNSATTSHSRVDLCFINSGRGFRKSMVPRSADVDAVHTGSHGV